MRPVNGKSMQDPQNYKADFMDDGRWFVAAPDGRRILCGDRRNATFTLARIYDADDPEAEFESMFNEAKSITDQQ